MCIEASSPYQIVTQHPDFIAALEKIEAQLKSNKVREDHEGWQPHIPVDVGHLDAWLVQEIQERYQARGWVVAYRCAGEFFFCFPKHRIKD